MILKIRKKKNTLLVSAKTFMQRHDLVIDGRAVPLTPTNIARRLGCSSQLIRTILAGERKSPNYTEKLIQIGFPDYIRQLYNIKNKEEL